MPKSDAIWGIDIGQCALKALKCVRHDDDDKRIVVEAFDYVEYPKILSQPDADPVELVREAITTFLSRNSVKNDRVAISVSGQNGLSRFIKLPPVEAKKIPDIVKYEAKQQIPFALEDVVWDYQQMGGGAVEEGFALETEVGLFAMKRDQVFRALRPFDEAKIEVDFVQLTPLALYNFISFDQLLDMPPADEIDPENPPDSVLVLSMGTDTTDLVVTNSYRVWQRSIPLGGNHFTKALTKELKLTFAKAEHLKRNATKAEDPKAVFQAMRPVFNDLVTEIDRSIRFFSGIDRNAKIGRVVALGNAMKLKGLEKFLTQNLQMDVKAVDAFRGLSGSGVVSSPAFKDNVLAFGVCYGLCLQGLKRSKLGTNLIPREIIRDRLIREKKPWILAAVAALLIGFGVSYFGQFRAWASAKIDDQHFKPAFGQIDEAVRRSTTFNSDFEERKKKFEEMQAIGLKLEAMDDNRVNWLEMLKAVSECLPHNKTPEPDINKRIDLFVDSIECERFLDLQDWWAEWKPAPAAAAAAPTAVPVAAAPEATAPPATPAATTPPADPAAATQPVAAVPDGPQGEGWVIQISGHHYHNPTTDRDNAGAEHIRKTLIRNLEESLVTVGEGRIRIKDLGISHPMLIDATPPAESTVPNPDAVDPNQEPGRGGYARPTGGVNVAQPAGGDRDQTKSGIPVRVCYFTVQFAWQETPYAVRKAKLAEAEAKAKKAAADAAAAGTPNTGTPNTAVPPTTPTAPPTTVPATNPVPPANTVPPATAVPPG